MKHLLTVAAVFVLLSASDTSIANDEQTNAESFVALETARAQATVLHDTMHTTLQITHDRFYREDEGLMIPAAAMKEVFADLKKRHNIALHWLVVEGQAMNTDHEAQNEFEEAAVKALKSGKPSHEQIGNGRYRRAAPIRLSNHCLKCHVPDRKNTRDRVAGLIISVPIRMPSAERGDTAHAPTMD